MCKSRNFLVLLNLKRGMLNAQNLQKQKFSCVTQLLPYSPLHFYLQKQKFSCVTQRIRRDSIGIYLQKQKFSCVTQQCLDEMDDKQSAKAEIFLCYSTLQYIPSSRDLQKQKFSCVTQRVCLCIGYVYLQKQKFSCVTQPIATTVDTCDLQKQKFSCVTQLLIRHFAHIFIE